MVLPDVLKPGLKVVFCGTAVGAMPQKVGAYYAGPGNQFWDVLCGTGLTPRKLDPHDFCALPKYGIGLTDLVKTYAGTDDRIYVSPYDVQVLRSKIARFVPKALAFNGKKAAKKFFGRRRVCYGRQPEQIGDSVIFVLPSTSPAARGYWDKRYWRELAHFVSKSDKAHHA
jgi:TDG/mug DNA glycosylase family protein